MYPKKIQPKKEEDYITNTAGFGLGFDNKKFDSMLDTIQIDTSIAEKAGYVNPRLNKLRRNNDYDFAKNFGTPTSELFSSNIAANFGLRKANDSLQIKADSLKPDEISDFRDLIYCDTDSRQTRDQKLK